MDNRAKFRVYNTKRGCYEDSRNHAIDCDGILYEFKHGLKPINMDIRIIEWCTGLKDKNGDLIYEGDFIRRAGFECIYKVSWYEFGFRIRGKAIPFNHFNAMSFASQVTSSEIVGNIHTSPELLK